jgi:hypothetical protein
MFNAVIKMVRPSVPKRISKAKIQPKLEKLGKNIPSEAGGGVNKIRKNPSIGKLKLGKKSNTKGKTSRKLKEPAKVIAKQQEMTPEQKNALIKSRKLIKGYRIKEENLIKRPEPKSKILKLHNKIFNLANAYELVGGIHLDLYLSIFQNIRMYKTKNLLANINLLVALTLTFTLLYMLVYFTQKNRRAIEAYKKQYFNPDVKILYKNYMFLIEDITYEKGVFFSSYFNVMRIIKDPIIAFSIIMLFDVPIIQIGIPLTIMLYFTI